MESSEFRKMLELAIQGNKKELYKLIQLYMPLIVNKSIIKGKIDEDLRQFLLLHIIKNISKFKI